MAVSHVADACLRTAVSHTRDACPEMGLSWDVPDSLSTRLHTAPFPGVTACNLNQNVLFADQDIDVPRRPNTR